MSLTSGSTEPLEVSTSVDLYPNTANDALQATSKADVNGDTVTIAPSQCLGLRTIYSDRQIWDALSYRYVINLNTTTWWQIQRHRKQRDVNRYLWQSQRRLFDKRSEYFETGPGEEGHLERIERLIQHHDSMVDEFQRRHTAEWLDKQIMLENARRAQILQQKTEQGTSGKENMKQEKVANVEPEDGSIEKK